MKTRILAVMTMAGLLTLVLGTAAFAAEGLTFQSPTPASGQAVTGGETIKAVAEPPSLLGIGLVGPSVKSITVTIRPRPGFKAGSPVAATRQGATFEMAWDTNKDTPYNGGYDIEGVATLSDGKTMTATVDNVQVNNPPSTPAKPTAGVENSVVVVRWSANPELDITGYRVSRSVDDGAFAALGSVDATKALSFTDADAPVGRSLKYQLVAVRRSSVTTTGLWSPPSESAPLTVAPPPPAVAAGQTAPVPGAASDPSLGSATPLPLAAAAPAPAAISAPAFPTRKGAPPPVFKSRPSEIAFAPTLPFSGAPPQKFDTASEGSTDTSQDLTAPSGIAGTFTATNPLGFVVIGIVLLVASFFLAKTSRRILKTSGPPDDFLSRADFSGLGDIQLPEVEIQYPDFRAFRT